LFYGPHGLLVTGLPISDDNGNIIAVVWAKLANLFSDGDGIRAGLDWKGAQGVKPCFCHWNVLQKDSELLEDGDDTYVDITCVDPRRFRRWTQDELYATIDMLNAAWRRNQAGTMTNIALERLEKASGHNATPYGILGDVELREALKMFDATRYDWMHSALQNGTITWELFLFTQANVCVVHLFEFVCLVGLFGLFCLVCLDFNIGIARHVLQSDMATIRSRATSSANGYSPLRSEIKVQTCGMSSTRSAPERARTQNGSKRLRAKLLASIP